MIIQEGRYEKTLESDEGDVGRAGTVRFFQRSGRFGSVDDDVELGQDLQFRRQFEFDNISIRNGFIRKVFTLVGIMLLITSLITAIPYMHRDIRLFVRQSFALYIISWLIFTAVYIALICCESLRRKYPTNLICTAMLTLSMGILTMCICAYHNFASVLICLLILTICCAGISIFAVQTKYDLTSMLGVLFMCTMFLFVLGIIAIVASLAFKIQWVDTIYAALAALLFLAYLAVDIQLVMGGRKYEISPEEYIFAAITIFVDIVYIFWMLLGVVGRFDE